MNKSEVFERVLELSLQAASLNEIPIGAVVVKDGEIISAAHNETEMRKSFVAHAEMIAIEKASKKIGSKYLNDCELFVSLEPCAMCLHAAKLSRITTIHYLLKSEKFGAEGRAYFKTNSHNFEEKSLGIKQQELLAHFFKAKRS
ncbi:MAG: nucleoside deaminase [Bdellovibrionota bacterium]|jgi:tRNA(adenine34) deaminase